MHLLGAEDVSLEYPTKTVFDKITVGITAGDRIGIVGRNGDGKSTLLRLLSRQIEPDSGRVTYRGGVTIGLLRQSDEFAPNLSIAQVVVGDRPEHEWAGDPKIRDVLSGLLSDLDWHAPVAALSGGQRRRVALARLLAGEHDVIFLDEPTNHLDIDGVHWLAAHVRGRWPAGSGGLVVVTHDRWFLDEVCNLTWEVFDGQIEPFEGGYAAYVQQRFERDRQASAIEARRQNLLRKELAWLGRGAPARTAKPKFRMDAALELVGQEPPPRNSIELAKMATARLGKDVIELDGVSFHQPDSEVEILQELSMIIGPGDRIGLVGSNGAGKTTLIKLIRGDLQPTAGRVKTGKTVKIATLSQEVSELDEFGDERIHNLIAREKTTFVVDKKEVGATQLVEQLGFTSAQLQTPIRDLSGGQRRRLQLLRLLFGEPNLLILDEPTNDLDTDMLSALEDLLDSWPGTLIVISHDRYLLERVTDTQYAMIGDGRVRHLPRGVDQYFDLKSQQRAEQAKLGLKREAVVRQQTSLSGADRRSQEKLQAKLERQLEKLEQQTDELKQKLAEIDPSNYQLMTELGGELGKLLSEQQELENQWLEVGERLQV